ncbi:hypothetical protein NKG94_26425 [Micromonospora sp. M12]
MPRFVAEFGYQAPPAYATLRRALSDEPFAHDSPGMAHHQKAAGGDAKLQRGLNAHLPTPADFDDWHYLTQLNQARAIQLGWNLPLTPGRLRGHHRLAAQRLLAGDLLVGRRR